MTGSSVVSLTSYRITRHAPRLAELDEHLVLELLTGRDLSSLVPIVSAMNADDQADILALLDDGLREALIDALQPADAADVKDLLHYDPETAGGIMSTEYFSLLATTTAGEAISRLQASYDVEMAFYIYVINQPGHLVGVVSLQPW